MSRAPAPRDDEELIIDAVAAIWLPQLMERLSARFNRDRLIASLEAYILRGVDETQRVIAEAESGDEFCDDVLRRLWRNMIDAEEKMGATLRAYGLTPPRKRKPGRRGGYEVWLQKVGLALLIAFVSEFFGLRPTRDQASRNTLPASGCSIVKAALERRGDHKAEPTVQNIYLGVAGDIGRMWAAEGGLRERMRADLLRIWPELAQGPARLSRI